jgi:hypothetical protein
MGGAMSIVLAGSTSGTITLQEPAVAGTNTLSLPALTGTLLTNKTAGTVLQVVNSLSNAGSLVTVANSGSGVVRGDILSVSITPASTSNKLFIVANAFGEMLSKSIYGAVGILFEVNGTTYQVDSFALYGGGVQFQPNYPANMSSQYFLNAPATSAITIKLRGYSYNESVGTNSIRFQNASLTVMEIAG